MKIIRIIARLNVGGPAKHVVWLTRNLSDKNYESRLIAGTVPDGEEDMSYFARENGVEPIFIEEMSRELSIKDVVSLVKIYREIRKFSPAIIHTHTAKAGTIGRVAAMAYKYLTPSTLIGKPRSTRVVHTFHGHVFHSYYGEAKTSFFLAIEKFLARFGTDRIVVISEQQLQEINEKYGVGRREQFVVVPLGLDLQPYRASAEQRVSVRAELGISNEDFVVGFSGRLTEIKDVPMLLEVASIALQSGTNVRFLIVGDGALRDELERTAPANVTFLGNRTDVARLLSAFDIIALTSKNEGTPLSLIEAMAAGVPFVSTAVGGVVDLAGDLSSKDGKVEVHERGLLIRGRETHSFAAAIERLASDDALREGLSARGKVFVRDHYSLDRLTADIVKVYSELVTESDH